MNRALLRRVVPPLLLAPLAVVAPAHADVAASDTLAGTVFLPDGTTPAPAAAVDLMLADTAGQPIAGSAFARGVTDLGGHFAVNPPERASLVDAAQANGGELQVAVQVGKLSPHGSLDPVAVPGSDLPDVTYALADTTMRLVTTQNADGTMSTAFEFFVSRPVVADVERIAGTEVGMVLRLASPVTQRAAVLGMFNDPDLVAGWDNPNDPDVIPPLGSTLVNMAPSIDLSAAPAAGVVLVPPLPKTTGGGGGSSRSCGTDPSTYWWDDRHGHNNPPHTVTYVYLDTHSCTGDNNPSVDQVIYDWTGYSGTNDRHWRLYRLKFRSQLDDRDGADYTIKKPDPATGDYTTGSSGSITWSVGWDFAPFGASVGGTYNFSQKKIHAWQADGTGRLYHVSWISQDSRGSYGLGRNDGGGFTVEVPEGMSARAGTLNSIQVWMCYLPNPDSYDDVTCDK